MTERAFRQLVRKLEARETFPLIALEALHDLRAALDDAEADAIQRARELGATAEDIALALGITRQGAYYKLKRLEQIRRATADEEAPNDERVMIPEIAERGASSD